MDTRYRSYHHVCPNRDWFASFEKLDGCYVVISDDCAYNIEGISTVHIKMFDGMVWIEGSEVYISTEKESYLCWCLKSIGS